jgi:predicted metal-dependent peptidase
MFSTSTRKYTATKRISRGQPIHLTPVGGGGTDFRPCFCWLEEKGIYPQTLVFLTDLWVRFPTTRRATRSFGPPQIRDKCRSVK